MKPARLLIIIAAVVAAGATGNAGAPDMVPPGTSPCCRKDSSGKTAADPSSRTQAPTAPFSNESIYQLDVRFTDDSGQPFTLGSLRGRPVVLAMFFASCGYACPLTVTTMLTLQQQLSTGLRDRTAFVLVSFDSDRDTPAALARYRTARHLGTHWILLHGEPGSVRELAALLGVQYQQGADGSYSHSNVLTVLNHEGEIVHQRLGLQGGLPETVRALVDCAP